VLGGPGTDALTINVTGEAKGKPDTAFITLAGEATAGNASDALQQCKQKADVAATAIRSLGIKGCEVVREMYEFSSPAPANPYGGMQPSSQPTGTKVSQEVKVKIGLVHPIDAEQLAVTISKVFDAANKSGVGLRQVSAWRAQVTGQSAANPVTYVITDATELRKAAITDAVVKAEEIRKVLVDRGIDLGPLSQVGYSGMSALQAAASWQGLAGGTSTADEKSANSVSPDEVTIHCSLSFAYRVKQPLVKP